MMPWARFASLSRHFWVPSPLVTVPVWVDVACAVLVLGYAGLKLSFPDLFDWIEPLALVCLWAFFRYGRGLRNDLPVWLLGASLLVVLIVWLAGSLNHPDMIRQTLQLEHLARHFLFVFLALWLGGQLRNTLTFLGLALFGILAIPWAHGGGWPELLTGLGGARVYFDLQNWQHPGMLFGAGLLGWVVLSRRLIGAGPRRVVRLVGWIAVAGALLVGILVNQTRAVFLALGVVVLLAGMAWLVTRWRVRDRGTRGAGGWLPVALVTGVILLGALGMERAGLLEPVAERFKAEMHVVSIVAEGRMDEVPINSIGARILSWQAAWSWFVERPILGWGANGGTIVMQNSPETTHEVFRTFGHLHSSYVEMAIRYGLLGVSLYLVLAFWVGWRTWVAWRAGTMPGDFFAFFSLFFVYWVIVNLFESYLFFGTGIYLFNVVMAALMGFIWRDRLLGARGVRAEKDP
ncbi:MAG: O-antigen ligase family protein [Halothiobacillaceae bacterium]